MFRTIKTVATTLLCACSLSAFSQSTLTAGDIAITAFNTDDPDQFAFVTLVDLQQGTQLKFTDNGWNGSALTTNEGTFTWTASSNITKGTVINVNPTGISFSTSGDQLFVYQGTSSSPVFIFGLSTRNWVTGSINANTSRKPAALVTGTTALAFSTERDNGYYNQVSTSGTKAQVLALIANSSKWTRSDSRYSTFPSWIFTVTGGVTSNEPTVSASNMSFSNFTSYQGTTSFTAAPNFTGQYLVVRSTAPQTGLPVDGTSYTVGDAIGNGKVIYNGTNTTVAQKGLRASSTYYYKVYTYLGTASSIDYFQTGALSGSYSTPSTMEGSYYALVDSLSGTFITDLQNIIRSPYTKVSYDLYDETMVAQFEFRDTTGGQKVQECAYSGQIYNYTPPFVWYTTSPFSREHTWCVSWMPSGGTTGLNEYADQHHLFTVNQNSANGVRSNHPLGEVVNVTSTYLQGTYGTDANGNNVYEPKDSQKGDAARALLYMALRYDGINGFEWNFDQLNNLILPSLGEAPQDLSTLIAWHFQDLPDNYEISRNDYIQSIQGNRNPFVDHPYWVNLINFNDLSYAAPAQLIAMNKRLNEESPKIQIFPNPAHDIVNLKWPQSEDTNCTIEIYNMMGQIVFIEQTNTAVGQVSLPINSLSNGHYIVVTHFGDTILHSKFIKN